MKLWGLVFLSTAILSLFTVSTHAAEALHRIQWTKSEVESLRGLWIGSIAKTPADKTNGVADNARAARFGHRLFFDTRLSSDGQVACATCHLPALAFTDGRKLARGVGTSGRNTMTIIGAAYSPWLFWDGRKDSLWSQALGPMESVVEHGGDRVQYAHLVSKDAQYRAEYESLFGPLPDLSNAIRFPSSAGPVDDDLRRAAWENMAPRDRTSISTIFANLGKAIAAYERLLAPSSSQFDHYVKAILTKDAVLAKSIMSRDEEAGLRLFIGPGRCIQCHNSPLMTNNSFHNIGLADPEHPPPDKGRLIGVKQVLRDEFNCRSRHSDDQSASCRELDFIKISDPHFDRGFKTPTLRNVSKTAPYMHDGRFSTLGTALRHYNKAPRQPVGQTELTPLDFNKKELSQLEKFLRTLSSAPDVEPFWLEPPEN
ncbi:MAG: cytochrome-c peroxidase [Alphaproteobacteria bacterium]|nr:cytochrome-c peroxidase [Alphaproteobacteria bacterium]